MDVLVMVGVNCLRAAGSMLMNVCMTQGLLHTRMWTVFVGSSHLMVLLWECYVHWRSQGVGMGCRSVCKASADRRAGPT